MPMELRVLRYYLTVAREDNITRAADILHITQPTLSRQMAELEDELNTKLFERTNRKIALTEAGMLLRRRAEELVSLAEKTELEFKNSGEELTGVISIGSGVSSVVSENLPDFPDNSDQPEFYSEIDKISPAPEIIQENPIFTTTIRDSQIDLNRHLNNAEYASMIHDAVAEIIKRTPHFAEVQINFLAATKPDETLSVAAHLEQLHFEAAGFGSGQTKFHAAGTIME